VDELNLPLIPWPETVKLTGGTVQLPPRLNVSTVDEKQFQRVWAPLQPFADKWLPGLSLVAVEDATARSLCITKDETLEGESYSLRLTEDRVELIHNDDAGLFYGMVTLLQLLAVAEQSTDGFTLPALDISDQPRFRWRGMHLDVVRHFFPVDVIKRYLDVLALHKINVFHWHLTDDQGWRIEILQHPRLTEIGAWRTEEDGTRYGGFYTQDEIREVIRYAAERQITIVPEIELPGHARAALAAYPELSCNGEDQPVPTTWGVFDDVYCAGNDVVFALIEDVLTEVCDLFPGQYVHIGGDECPKTRWQNCPKCQERMHEEGLANPEELQAWFIRQAEQFLNEHGKRLIGWDEIMEGGLTKSAAVMAWRSPERGRAAAEAGHQVVMSPTSHCYFDYAQAESGEPEAFEAVLTLDQVFKFDPAPDSWPDQARENVLGGQGNMWTERIDTESHLHYMLLPRLCAMSERLWSSSSRQDSSFHDRLDTWLRLLGYVGYSFRENHSIGS
jgi:hexosaminidase